MYDITHYKDWVLIRVYDPEDKYLYIRQEASIWLRDNHVVKYTQLTWTHYNLYIKDPQQAAMFILKYGKVCISSEEIPNDDTPVILR